MTEKTGRLSDAEAFYRRASAIASASLPADHPMVAASRQNLEDFCRARGLPIEAPTLVTAAAPDPAPDTTPDLAPAPAQPAHPKRWALLAIGVIALVAVMVFVWRLSSSRWKRPRANRRPRPRPHRHQNLRRRWPQILRRRHQPRRQSRPPRSSGRKSRLPQRPATSQPAAASNPPRPSSPWPPRSCAGLLRRAPKAGVAIRLENRCRRGRWFSTRESSLHVMPRSCIAGIAETHCGVNPATIRANASGGYRTFSRQTVDTGADWRVEVRSAGGDLLHEQRFVVR